MRILILFILLTISNFCFSQNTQHYSISFIGGELTSSSVSLQFNGGDLVTEKLTSSNLMLTQGFEQAPYKIEDTLSVDIVKLQEVQISLYPNPSSDLIHIQTYYEFENCEIINALGSVMYSGNFTKTFNVSDFPKGSYYLRVSNSKNTQYSKFYVL